MQNQQDQKYVAGDEVTVTQKTHIASTSLPNIFNESGGFNFDVMMKLAQDDPDALHQAFVHEVKRIIERAPEERRAQLYEFQYKIDCVRAANPDPMDACVAITQLMLRSNQLLQVALNNPSELMGVNDSKVTVADALPYTPKGLE